MDSLGEIDPEELHDDYREAVEELVARRPRARARAPEPAPAARSST